MDSCGERWYGADCGTLSAAPGSWTELRTPSAAFVSWERPSFASAAANIMYEILNPGFAADRSPHGSGFGATPDKLEAVGSA
jgi:hypothetical protein